LFFFVFIENAKFRDLVFHLKRICCVSIHFHHTTSSHLC